MIWVATGSQSVLDDAAMRRLICVLQGNRSGGKTMSTNWERFDAF